MRNSLSFIAFLRNSHLTACLTVLMVVALSLAATPGQAQAPACDINGDGIINLVDLSLFVSCF